MTTPFLEEMKRDLKAHMDLCHKILRLTEEENRALQVDSTAATAGVTDARKKLLAELNASLAKIKQDRVQWMRIAPGARAGHPDILELLRQNQDLIMKVVVLDRDNEQQLLRRGMVPPTHLPSVQKMRPHFVADLYRRHVPG